MAMLIIYIVSNDCKPKYKLEFFMISLKLKTIYFYFHFDYRSANNLSELQSKIMDINQISIGLFIIYHQTFLSLNTNHTYVQLYVSVFLSICWFSQDFVLDQSLHCNINNTNELHLFLNSSLYYTAICSGTV